MCYSKFWKKFLILILIESSLYSWVMNLDLDSWDLEPWILILVSRLSSLVLNSYWFLSGISLIFPNSSFYFFFNFLLSLSKQKKKLILFFSLCEREGRTRVAPVDRNRRSKLLQCCCSNTHFVVSPTILGFSYPFVFLLSERVKHWIFFWKC